MGQSSTKELDELQPTGSNGSIESNESTDSAEEEEKQSNMRNPHTSNSATTVVGVNQSDNVEVLTGQERIPRKSNHQKNEESSISNGNLGSRNMDSPPSRNDQPLSRGPTTCMYSEQEALDMDETLRTSRERPNSNGMSSARNKNGNGNWKFIPPKEGELEYKVVFNSKYFWCDKCRKKKGVWTNHRTKDHIYGYRFQQGLPKSMHHRPNINSNTDHSSHPGRKGLNHNKYQPPSSNSFHKNENKIGEKRRNIIPENRNGHVRSNSGPQQSANNQRILPNRQQVQKKPNSHENLENMQSRNECRSNGTNRPANEQQNQISRIPHNTPMSNSAASTRNEAINVGITKANTGNDRILNICRINGESCPAKVHQNGNDVQTKKLGKSARAMLGSKSSSEKIPLSSSNLTSLKPKHARLILDIPITNRNRKRTPIISQSTERSMLKMPSKATKRPPSSVQPLSSKRIKSCPSMTIETPVETHNTDVDLDSSNQRKDVSYYNIKDKEGPSKSKVEVVGSDRSSNQNDLNSITISNHVEVSNSNFSEEKESDTNILSEQTSSNVNDKLSDSNEPNSVAEEVGSSSQVDEEGMDMDIPEADFDDDYDGSDKSYSVTSKHEIRKPKPSRQEIIMLSSDEESSVECNGNKNESNGDKDGVKDPIKSRSRVEVIELLSSDDDEESNNDPEDNNEPDNDESNDSDPSRNTDDIVQNNESANALLRDSESTISTLRDDIFRMATSPTQLALLKGKEAAKKRIISCKSAIPSQSKRMKTSSQKKVSRLKKGKFAAASIQWKSSFSDSSSASDSDSSESFHDDNLQTNDLCDRINSLSETIADLSRTDLKHKTRADLKSNRAGLKLNDIGRTLERELQRTSSDFLKSAGLFSVQKLLSVSTSKLALDYNKWRISSNGGMRIIPNPIAAAARWQDVATALKPQEIKDTPISNHSPIEGYQMQIVDHLTKTEIGGGQLPIRKITTMHRDEKNYKEILFDFRINIRKSNIPNSGSGAFLTFLGARKLKEEAKQKSINILMGRIYVESDTTKSLQAKIGNYNLAVTLKGHDLHGNGNNNHFTCTRFPLQARDPGNGHEYSVKIGPHEIHEDIQNLRDRKEIPFPKNGLGFLQMFTEKDYEDDDEIKYNSDQFGNVDIGRYGPFLKTDRKTQQEFNLKDFIMDYEPAGWNFGVEELYKGCAQVIDVTDDCTGEPHTIARDNIPMYVNEVGHDLTLKQNVIAREADDRVVHYYISQREPMSKGDTVELLVDYGETYEATRIRKGYGKKNIEDGLECDKDKSSRFKRDHSERASIKIMIQTMTFIELQNALIFLRNQIFPLVHYTDAYFTGLIDRQWPQSMKVPTLRQLRARQRLNFVGQMFRKKLDNMIASKNGNDEIIEKMYSLVDENSLNPFLKFDFRKLQKEDELWEMYRSERFAEITLEVSNSYDLFHSYDPSIWCSIARNLCRDLSNLLIDSELEKRKNPMKSVDSIYEVARYAAHSIKNACYNLSSKRSSMQTILESCRLLGLVRSGNDVINAHLSSSHLTINEDHPKVVLIQTGHTSGTSSQPSVGISNSLELFCPSLSPLQKRIAGDRELVLRCIAKEGFVDTTYSAQLPIEGIAKVDSEWYLLWQVVRVVDVFAKRFKYNNTYSLQKLCEEVQADFSTAESIISVEMKEPFESIYIHCDEDGALNYDENQDENIAFDFPDVAAPKVDKLTMVRRETRPRKIPTCKYDETDGTLPEGWKMEEIQRQNSKHVDRYWYTKTGKKLRSRIECAHFLELIKQHNGDEEAAWERYPGNRKKRQSAK